MGPAKLDALLLSPTHGLVAFDLVEGTDAESFKERQDDVASMLEVRLKPHPGLKTGRELRFPINVVTYAPAKKILPDAEPPYFMANDDNLVNVVRNFQWTQGPEVFSSVVAVVQVVTSIRAGRLKREPKTANSRGARLKRIEESIANLDQHQSQAVIETVGGVQRIRGLAGSGKTIVLALKVAYLHAQNPAWRIGVTFNTRSLKEQFRRLINNFTIEQTGIEPDWGVIEVLNAWGAPGDKDRDGIYHKFCRENSVPFSDFSTAKVKFGEGREFAGVCAEALAGTPDPVALFDMMLIDEAQDLPAEFLRLCYASLIEPGRLVYAYDELQSLNGEGLPPPESIFGAKPDGTPVVRLNVEETGPRQDIILEKCYRNSRPVLAAAHALGFGICRKSGLVQIFEQDTLWTDVGYVVEEGELAPGQDVTLARTLATSPEFLEAHSPPEDLIQFHKFEGSDQQTAWLVEQIKTNIREDELRPEDIVVINPSPITTQREVGPARKALFAEGVNAELAGVSTSADVFTKARAVTFTGIYRAKGNEAGMVYIMNAQDCVSGWDQAQTAQVRNRLFTAITRSKAWVRILGIGKGMDTLIAEWDALRQQNYKLKFRYPTEDQKKQLRLINKDIGRKRKKSSALKSALMQAVKDGSIDPDQMILELEKMRPAGKP